MVFLDLDPDDWWAASYVAGCLGLECVADDADQDRVDEDDG